MIVLPGPVVLRDPLPAGWRRCPSLGCGAPTGHDGAHVPEAVPPVAVAGPEVDVGAEVAPTRAERIEAAARRLVRAQETTYAIEATCGLGEQRSDALRAEVRAFDALRAALCSCTGHGPDLACVEHGEALRRWREENGT